MLTNLSDVDLRKLRIFCTIVEAGGFTAAQVRLNTSLPRLSTLVRDLEIRLGYSLCRRGKSGFQLSEQGAQTYAAAQELYADIDRFHRRVVMLNEKYPEFLQIGSVDNLLSLDQAPLPQALASFRLVSPSTRIDLQVMRADELEQAVLEGRLHLAIGCFNHQLSGLHYQALFEEEQNLYCGRGHPFFARPDEHFTDEEIGAADYVDRGYMLESRRPHKLRFGNSVSAFSMEAIATLIASGTCIGYLPTHYADIWVARGMLRVIAPQRLRYNAAFHSITRQGQVPTESLAKLMQALQAAKHSVTLKSSTRA
ncbi:MULTISPECIES: LysR family transcriptional regulator [Pseudomonas]|uniref:LysR family transcriptional regulator n=1 Tax=Pseudomonas TaxID=286 RepID=UPI00087646DB|nr:MULTISPECIES: LysR family transcriptional regulator [Pseudomonas]PNV98397.1 LysR family transcriptional regulator [Pseudomonas protegens]UVM08599.1 LysR family transcriptional regulator [Pseudomonas protegens]SCZ51853.1 transcriptional regulator, LysR family [Pseudomonas sp. NFPP17]SDA39921.1 transcriptional regulator, LysR family [Pseudomonas sp. NFPP15]SEK45677.1 transcriptional regulator, LysR family [Pseudomonas sp. NFPP18]